MKKLTAEQEEAIRKYYPEGNHEELARWFPDKSRSSIKYYAHRLGVRSRKSPLPVDITGRQFGRLTALQFDHRDKNGKAIWKCICSCGKETVVRYDSLISGNTKSCGCQKGKETRKRPADFSGTRFGNLTALERLPNYKGKGKTYYRCICDCGSETAVEVSKLRSGHTKSCGRNCALKKKSQKRAEDCNTAKKKSQRRAEDCKAPKKKLQNRPVNQYDLDGLYLKTYASVAEAARQTGISCLSHALRENNPYNAAGGFQWRYDEGDHQNILPFRRGKPVFQIDLNTNQMISEYWSIKEAVRQTGINQSLISLCCARKRLTAGGFVWRYQDDPKTFSEEDIEERKRLREKAVNQYDLNGRYLRTFESISEAKRITGVSAVPRAVLGDLSHCKAGGFQWRYDSGDHSDIPKAAKGRPIVQIDPRTNQIVATYKSATEAERQTGIYKAGISLCCRGKSRQAGEYLWQFQGDPAASFTEDEVRLRRRRETPVNQYDLDGHYIRTYRSITEANRATGAGSISQVVACNSNYKSSGGYQWQEDTGNHEDIPPVKEIRRSVLQIEPKTNRVISEYYSITEASKTTGIDPSNISRCCRGACKSAGKFVWRYGDDPEDP